MARPFIPVEWVAVVDFNQRLDGVPFCNSFYWYAYLGGWDLGKLVTLAGAMNDWFINNYLPLQSFDVQYLGATVKDLTTEDGLSFSFPVFDYFGGQVSASMPLNDAIYIKSSNTRRAGDPYYYWVAGGFPKEAVVGNQVEQEYLDALYNAYITLQDVEPGIGIDPVHVQYITNGAYRSEGRIRGFGATYRPKRQIGTRARRVRNKVRTP